VLPAPSARADNALLAVLGPERCAHGFERFLEEFVTADDARFITSVGLSLARTAVTSLGRR
jgi:hypothetical protein